MAHGNSSNISLYIIKLLNKRIKLLNKRIKQLNKRIKLLNERIKLLNERSKLPNERSKLLINVEVFVCAAHTTDYLSNISKNIIGL